MQHHVAEALRTIKQRMQRAAEKSGRAPDDIKLIAVSKFHPVEAVQAVRAAGHSVFGENRVQEASQKFGPLRPDWPELELHMIGPLQTNKAEDAVRLFDVIQTLDRPRLVDALVAAIRKLGRTPRFYVEVNIGLEPQKAGVIPDDLPGFLDYCRGAGLAPVGLMCIPPAGQDASLYFSRMRTLALAHHLPHLSMGMSDDFEEAIAMGATEVRIGTALFGTRAQQA